ncbi:hypothetical protein LTR66_003266 [Elasticomyces elasticus]|nr:hypothetical protein LTR66_003266 [Elasticomyces elasticus]
MVTATCQTPPSEHLDGVGYLFGYPIAHSLSPLFHRTIYDALGLNWTQFPLPSTDMSHFLRLMQDPRCFGASVTMPHKIAILEHLDEMTPEGRAVGACNTLFFRQSGSKRLLIGTNTDIIGVHEAFYKNMPDPDQVFHHRPGMVIGGGGAARSAVYALKKHMQCDAVYLVNRDKAEVDAVIAWCSEHGYGDGLLHVSTPAQAAALEGPGAIVACVPNFPPKTPEERQARAVMLAFLEKRHKGAMLEMCYHPTPWTEIAELAQARGWRVVLGTEAMIWQGLEQDKLWTGRELGELPVEKVKDVIAKQLSKVKL